MVSWCNTLISFLTNPLTLTGGIGTGVALKLLYNYSRFSFWPSMLSVTAIWRTLMTTVSGASSLLRTDLLKYAATFTTFSQSIKLLLSGDFTVTEIIVTPLQEFVSRVVATVPSWVEGLSSLSTWLAGSKGNVCGLVSSGELFWTALWSIWTGIATVLFVLWIWEKTWYDWRNVQMESQEKYLIVGLVVLGSVSVHSTAVLFEGLSSSESLANSLGNYTGNLWNATEVLNETGNQTVNTTK